MSNIIFLSPNETYLKILVNY